MNQRVIQKLKKYFEEQSDIALAFVFGSRPEGRARPDSDWDIAVYFKPLRGIELETQKEYPHEKKMWGDLARITGVETDLLVLNRARPSLVFDVLNTGRELVRKDDALFINLLLKTHYEAVDYWSFVKDFWAIREQAASLTPKARALLIEHLTFLENELSDLPKFRTLQWPAYNENRSNRREVERWVENIVMSTLDIAKIMLASEKRGVPQTYTDTLKQFAIGVLNEAEAERLAQFAALRNLVVHEYLDMRFARIQQFIKEAETLLPPFIRKVKEIINT